MEHACRVQKPNIFQVIFLRAAIYGNLGTATTGLSYHIDLELRGS